jgi:hypothetical protein
LGVREDLWITPSAQSDVANVRRGVASLSQNAGSRSWHILVDKKNPQLGDSSHFLGGQYARRVAQGRANVLDCDSIFVDNFVERHSAGQLCDHQLDWNSSAFDDRLPESHQWINDDARRELNNHSSPPPFKTMISHDQNS